MLGLAYQLLDPQFSQASRALARSKSYCVAARYCRAKRIWPIAVTQ
jgi:hypothetical protein